MMEWEDIETRRIASSVRGGEPVDFTMALNRKFHEGATVRGLCIFQRVNGGGSSGGGCKTRKPLISLI